MSISSIQVSLLLGKVVPTAAPAELMTALDSIEVTQGESFGFQLGFRVQRGLRISPDFAVVGHPLLQPGTRIIITVTVSAMPRVLMDGVITHQQLSQNSGGGMLLTVTGEDISLWMDMYEIALEYPGLGDAEIALLVLAKYAVLGVVPMVIPPLTGLFSNPLERIPQQSGTDRRYLQGLAAEHGYIFYVRPGPVPLTSVAYWGPVNRIALPQKALTVDSGPATNVESINFSYDALAPEQIYGAVSDADLETVLPVITLVSTRLPPLASMQPLIFNQPFVRKTMLDYQGSSFVDALSRAQAVTNESVAAVVTAQGTVNVLRYGDIMSAPGYVGVRGAGYSYDGYYLVKSVTHSIRLGQYTQSFNLAREGTGSLTTEVQP